MNQDVNVLARTLYGEAERDDVEDLKAIANVVMNRVHYRQWPNTVKEVCLQPKQFSCWNEARTRNRIQSVTREDEWFDQCWNIAEMAVSGALYDNTGGSTHYYATYIPEPSWARGKVPVYTTPAGQFTHRFYNDIDTPKPASKRNPFVVGDEGRISKTMVTNAIVTVCSIGAFFFPELAPYAEPETVKDAAWIGTATGLLNMVLRWFTSGRIKPKDE